MKVPERVEDPKVISVEKALSRSPDKKWSISQLLQVGEEEVRCLAQIISASQGVD